MLLLPGVARFIRRSLGRGFGHSAGGAIRIGDIYRTEAGEELLQDNATAHWLDMRARRSSPGLRRVFAGSASVIASARSCLQREWCAGASSRPDWIAAIISIRLRRLPKRETRL